MSNLKIRNVIIASAVSLALYGCSDDSVDTQDQKNYATQVINNNRVEQQKFLNQMKQTDPNIQNVYYSVDDDNHQIVNIVRKDNDSNTLTQYSWVLFAGLTMTQFMSHWGSTGINSLAQSFSNYKTTFFNGKKDQIVNQNQQSASYYGFLYNYAGIMMQNGYSYGSLINSYNGSSHLTNPSSNSKTTSSYETPIRPFSTPTQRVSFINSARASGIFASSSARSFGYSEGA